MSYTTMDTTTVISNMTMNSTMNTTMNSSMAGDDRVFGTNTELITLLTQISNVIILVCLMLAMGCTIDLKDLKETFRHPVGFLIGMLCQFVLLPLVAFCMCLAFRLETAAALSVLIIACCPGGTLSNLFTYWTDGDVCLSVCMTAVSTAVAVGMMPLNLFIYSRVWTDDNAIIPYVNIVTTLVSILIPVAFGVFVRWWKKDWTKYITRLGLVIAILCIIAAWILFFLLDPYWLAASWKLWVCAMLLPFLGYGFGYGLAFLLRQPHFKCRAISFETGSQNVSLASTLIILTFVRSPYFLDMIFYPALYPAFLYIDSFIIIAFMKIVRYCRKKRSSNNDNEKFGCENEGKATDQKEDLKMEDIEQTYARD